MIAIYTGNSIRGSIIIENCKRSALAVLKENFRSAGDDTVTVFTNSEFARMMKDRYYEPTIVSMAKYSPNAGGMFYNCNCKY